MLKKLLSVTLAVCMTVPMWSAPFAEDAAPVSSSSDTTVSSSSDATDLDLSGAADPDADGAADPDADGAADPDADGHPVEADKSVTAWTWDDPDGLLQQDGDAWVLGLAGVSELTDDVWAEIRDDLLPQAVTATVDGATETVALTWTLTGSTAMAALAEGYTLAETAPALTVRLETGGATTYTDADVNPIVTPQNINGTTIDVFDYWLTTQSGNDSSGWSDDQANSGINNGHVLLFGKGMSSVNFAAASGGSGEKLGSTAFNNNGNWNGWTGGGNGPTNGIVNRLLGDNGYPTLDLHEKRSDLQSNWQSAHSLPIEVEKRTESLAYLFDPTVSNGYKASFTNVGGFLQIDNEGYYYYNSQWNFAALVDGLTPDEQTQYDALRNSADYTGGFVLDGVNFKLYSRPGLAKKGSSPNGQFFPFNGINYRQSTDTSMTLFPSGDWNSSDSSKANGAWYGVSQSTHPGVNHYFGIHMQTRFIQQYGGHVTNQQGADSVTYEFSGDDDVWIFIDGVLVADLGGIHDAVKVTINFSTGVIEISSASTHGVSTDNPNGTRFGAYETTLYKQFEAAKKENSVSWDSSSGYTIFADNTYHTLDFFYLERGNTDSNMYLKYNLVTVPESAIVKVDQTGDRLADVGFSLYLADENYNLIDIDTGDTQNQTPLASGTTDANGTFLLKDQDDYLLSLDEIWREYTNQAQSGRLNLVLRETSAPDGYRTSQEVRLYLVESGGNVVLLSDNQWKSGAYAYSNVAITVGGDGKHIRYNGSNDAVALDPNQAQGFAFAVVLRRDRKTDDPLTDKWSLVIGDAVSGWNVSAPLEQGETGIGTLLAGLKAVNPDGNTTNNYFKFNMTSSGAFVATVTDLPGSILEYYYMLDANKKNDAEMTLAFYYTTASSLENATERNTFRVTGDSGENSTTNDWDRLFATNVYVPNIKNRLLVQKLSTSGTTLTDAKFALYKASDVTVDQDGKYTIHQSATPVDTVTTDNLTQADNGITLNGGGVFPTPGKTLNNGVYYLVETQARDGYIASDRAVKVIVDATGVYADAGAADDGVTVARGLGSIVKSMTQFATEDEIDATLHNIVAKFYTVDSSTLTENNVGTFTWRTVENGEFTPAKNVTYHPAYYYDENTKTWHVASQVVDATALTPLGMHLQYDPSSAQLEYAAYPTIEGATVAQVTDVGWSALLVEQCYQHSNNLQKDGYNVTNLTDPLIDLTNLFSGTVTVRVENAPETSLTISKTAENGTVYGAENFQFNVAIPREGEFTCSVYELNSDGSKNVRESGMVEFATGGTLTAVTPAGGAESTFWTTGQTTNLTLADGQYAAIEAIPAGTTVTATETIPDDATWKTYCTTTVSVNDAAQNTGTMEGSVKLEQNNASTIAFTNTFKTGTITVRKQGVVNGAKGTPLTGAGFTLTDNDDSSAVWKEERTDYAVRVTLADIPDSENFTHEDYDSVTNRYQEDYVVHKNTYEQNTGTEEDPKWENWVEYYYYRDLTADETSDDPTTIIDGELVAIARFEDLRLDHTYTVTESTVPVGYRPAENNDPMTNIEFEAGQADVHYIVRNTKLVLPSSGGHGVVTVTALGFAMILGGGALLATSRKRKKN